MKIIRGSLGLSRIGRLLASVRKRPFNIKKRKALTALLGKAKLKKHFKGEYEWGGRNIAGASKEYKEAVRDGLQYLSNLKLSPKRERWNTALDRLVGWGNYKGRKGATPLYGPGSKYPGKKS